MVDPQTRWSQTYFKSSPTTTPTPPNGLARKLPLDSTHLGEVPEPGRMDRTANAETAVRWSEGSNPSLSASRSSRAGDANGVARPARLAS